MTKQNPFSPVMERRSRLATAALVHDVALHFDRGARTVDVAERGWLQARQACEREIVHGDQIPRRLVSHSILTGDEEIDGLIHLAGRARRSGFQGMSFAVKEHDLTFSNRTGRMTGNLDHAIVSSGLQLANLGNLNDGTPFAVRVEGWQQLVGAARIDFIDNV